MNFADLDKGEKTDMHLRLYANEMAILDEMCERFHCSRAAAVSALLREYGLGETIRASVAVGIGTRRRNHR